MTGESQKSTTCTHGRSDYYGICVDCGVDIIEFLRAAIHRFYVAQDTVNQYAMEGHTPKQVSQEYYEATTELRAQARDKR